MKKPPEGGWLLIAECALHAEVGQALETPDKLFDGFRLRRATFGIPHEAEHLLDAGHQRNGGPFAEAACIPQEALEITNRLDAFDGIGPVSYTHLTLPTSDLV